MKNLILLIFLLFFTSLFAQEEEKDSLKYETEQLVITGTRTYEKIIDIPYSVFRVDKKELSFGRKISAKDVLADVPGLFLQSRYGNHDIRVTMRGYGTRSNTGVRGIKILQDGIPESEPDGETVIDAIDFSSLGGVEVVKGNMSSLYGNAPGGAINFISDLYFPKNFVNTFDQYGKYGLMQGGLKTGIKTDDYRFFISYGYHNIDGYRQHSSEYGHLLNSVFEGYLGNKAKISVLANYVNNLIRLPGSLTKEQFEQDPLQARDLAVSQDFRRETRKGRLGIKFNKSFGKTDNNEIELMTYGGVKDLLKTDDVNYILSTRYSLGSIFRFTNRSEFFKRSNLFTTGVDLAYQTGPRTEYDNLAGKKGLNVNNQYDDNQSNTGIYIQNQFEILKGKMNAYFAARYDRIVLSKNALQYRGNVDTSRVFENVSPKIALNYKLTPYIALYTSYGLGFDYPTVSELDNNYTTSNIKYTLNPDLKPQSSNNFELGIKGNILNKKSEFLRKLLFDVTFFNYVIKDEIVPFTINQSTYFRNAGKTNRTGIEVGIMSEPIDRIELTVNYTYTNFKYKDYKAEIQGPAGNYTETYDNNSVPSIPQHIFNFILNYEWEISEEVSGLLQWDCDYIAKMYVNDNNSESTPDYFYGNAMAGINLTFGKINAIGYFGVNNIFDKRYAGFVNINDFSGRYYETGEPRDIYSGLKLSYYF